MWLKVVPVVLKWTLEDGINFVKENYLNKKWAQKEGIVWIPKGGFLDRMWRRISVKIKQDHFK